MTTLFYYKYSESMFLKGTVKQIGKALINDSLSVSKVSWKFCFPTTVFSLIVPLSPTVPPL